jgi:hypothetical protein
MSTRPSTSPWAVATRTDPSSSRMIRSTGVPSKTSAPALACLIEQQFVEVRPLDIEDRKPGQEPIGELELPRRKVVAHAKLGPELWHVGESFHRVFKPQLLEEQRVSGQDRFADVKPRVDVLSRARTR